MAITEIRAGKASPGQAVLTLIRGDGGTHAVRICVQRYCGGVDLSPLSWSVTVENAAGATDEYSLTAKVNEKTIETEWIPEGTATAAVGITRFKLSGFGDNGKALVWQSGTYHIRIDDTIAYVPDSETETALTNVQKLIIYVDGELNRVIKAADAAEAAAEAANRAADRAEGTANGTRIAALEKFTTEPENYSVTGNMVQLDNYSGMPMHCVTHIEPVQAGSGDPSPSNVRPISGFTGAKLTKCGKNLLKLDSSASGIQGGVTFTANPDGTVTLSGTASNDIYRTLATNVSLPNGDYILNGCPTGVVDSNYLLYWAPAISSNKVDSGHGVQFTVDNQETYKVMVRIKEGTDVTGFVFKPMIRLATETDAVYEPYQGETFSANFGQTVYGGTMDWNTGVLTVDKACIAFDGTEAAAMQAENSSWARYNLTGRPTNALLPAYTAICSHFRTRQKTTTEPELVNTVEIHGSSNYPIFRVDNSKWSTVEAFKSYLAEQYAAGTPVQILYELATPAILRLTPAQITALQGMNNIRCDAGETTVSGRKDILWLTDYLIDRIKALETAIISTGGNV